MVFNRSGSSEYPGVRYAYGTSSYTLQDGQGYYDYLSGSGVSRWGDYSGIALDPSGTYLERMIITDKSGKVTQLTKKLLLMK